MCVHALRLPYPPIYNQEIEMGRCQVTDVRPRREMIFGWQSRKLELELLSHYISHRLAFLYPGRKFSFEVLFRSKECQAILHTVPF